MTAPDLLTVVITCPHCGTRYQVAQATLGPSGRSVQCAHCQKSWQASAAPAPAESADQLFDPAEESALDNAFEDEARAEINPATGQTFPDGRAAPAAAEPAIDDAADAHRRMLAEIKAAIAPKPNATPAPVDPAADKTRRRAFLARQDKVRRKLPLARIRRNGRVVALLLFIAMFGGGFVLRTEIVRQFPALAGLYAAVGLKVNVVGLEFREVQTLLGLSNGKDVMRVSAQIYSITNSRVVVPPVLITLLNANGVPIYEWSVTPVARDLDPGEVIDISSQVTNPPDGASRIKLSFANARTQTEAQPIAVKPAGTSP